MTLYKDVEITLDEYSSAGNPLKKFTGQAVEIELQPTRTVTGVDGRLSVWNEVSPVLWHRGTAKDLKDIHKITIVARDGTVVFDGDVNRHTDQPTDTPQGVRFNVFSSG
ncbi:MAG TPA: hypothetical protein VGC34_14970 [Steroidobacteraceae bacterium]